MPLINESCILVMATHGFAQAELEKPVRQLKARGARVSIAAPEAGQIKGWKRGDWGAAVDVDLSLDEVEVDGYDALVLPGGVMNADRLRYNERALAVVKAFLDAGKIVAAICHAPLLLVEVGAVKGRQITCYPSVRTDIVNAGGRWVDKQVVVDGNIITSRNLGDVDAFIAKIIEMVEAGTNQRAA